MAEIFEIAPWMLQSPLSKTPQEIAGERQQFNEEALAAHLFTQLRQDGINNGMSPGQATMTASTQAPALANMFARRTLETIKMGQDERLENIKLQNEIRTREGLAQIAGDASTYDFTSDDDFRKFMAASAKNPFAIGTAGWQGIRDNFTKARAIKSREQIASDIALAKAIVGDEIGKRKIAELEWKKDNDMLYTVEDRAWLNDIKSQSEFRNDVNLEELKQLNRLELVEEKTRVAILSSKSWINRQRAAAFRAEVDSVLKDPMLKYNKAKRDAALQEVFAKYPESKDLPVITSETYKKDKPAAEPVLNPEGLVPGSEVTPVAPSEVAPAPQAPPPDAAKGVLTPEQANAFLKAADGNEERATALALQSGYKLPSAPDESHPEVIRMTKEGRAAIFDAITKQFLRYAD